MLNRSTITPECIVPDHFRGFARRFPRAAAALAGCGAALVLSGCQSLDATSASGAAQVRFVNTSRNAGSLDLYMNGGGAAYNLGFTSFTTYVPFAPGTYAVNAARANTTQTLVSAHAALTPGRLYTAVVVHALSGLSETIYEDQNTPAAPNSVAVRVLDEADDLGPVDVYVRPSGSSPSHLPIANGLREGGNSGYVDVPAAAGYTITVVPAGLPASGPGSAVVATVSMEGGSGAVRTVILANSSIKPGGWYGFVLNDADPN